MPGYPIRTPSDHSSVDSSPRLIAASYVLHRLLMPRHPPYALHNLHTTNTTQTSRCSHPLYNSQTPTSTTAPATTTPPPRGPSDHHNGLTTKDLTQVRVLPQDPTAHRHTTTQQTLPTPSTPHPTPGLGSTHADNTHQTPAQPAVPHHALTSTSSLERR